MKSERWQQVEQVCHAALARPPDSRAAYLDEACADDEDLRRDVESLLVHEEAAAIFLSTPAIDVAVGAIAQAPWRSLIGHSLGPYLIEAPLGAGGMGEVFRARDTKLDREVALKILPPDLASDPERLARFDREARILAGLNHPAILTIHDVGTAESIPFVVTELLEGQTLRDVLDDRLLSQREALGYALQAAQGLAAAHRRGIVHCDLKPENLFLTNDGRLKILDFGLATRTPLPAPADGPPPGPTEAGPEALFGTVAYMSPEQINGQVVDARADVFAFGIVLFEMLTRQHPFRRDTPRETVTAILHDTLSSPTSLSPAVPPVASAIVCRCLAKSRDDRYGEAHELADALAAAVEACARARGVMQDDPRSPYPGLRSFTEQDAHVFVGREQEVAAFWDRVRLQRLLAVIGPSGAGKTSFLRAGVVPSRPDDWAVLVCTPGIAPMRSLGQALKAALASGPDAVAQLAAFEDAGVVLDLVQRWRGRHGEALLIVDQFEEVFTLNPPAMQARVASVLGRLVADADIHLVLSMRDDFLIRCCEHPALAPVLSQLIALLPLGHDGLRRALVEPAAVHGYRFEPEALVDEMVTAVEDARSALPLLAFAVARLWERRDRERSCLTRASYLEIGGVTGALVQRAEEAFERLGADREPVVRELFRNLVTAHGTRAVIDREELLSVVPDRTTAEAVLHELVDARLLTSYQDAGDGRTTHHRVEIAHESLLSAWPRLVRWRTQDEEGAQLRDQLRQAAHLWDERRRLPELLWTGTAYREYALWRERYTAPLSAIESSFVAAMIEKARRKKRLAAAAIVIAFVGLATVAASIATSRQRAVASAHRSEASKLVALGRLELDRHPTAAVAYARKSLEMSDTIEARLLALEALWRGPVARTLTEINCGVRLAMNPGASLLACSGFQPDILMVSRDGPTTSAFRILPTMADTRESVFVDEGRLLLTWLPGDDSVRLLDLQGRQVRSFPGDAHLLRLVGKDAFVTCGAAANSRDRVVRLWSWRGNDMTVLDVWTPPHRMRFNQPGVRPLDIDPQLRWLAYGSDSGVFLHQLGSRQPDRLLGRHAQQVREVLFDPAGQRLLSTDEGGGFRLWAIPDGALLEARTLAPASRFSLTAFRPDGGAVSWTTSGEGTSVWNLADPPDAPPLLLRQPDADVGGQSVISADGQWLASGSANVLRVWPITLPYSRVLRGHTEGLIERIVFSPDSSYLVSCARDGARLWSITAGGAMHHRVDIGADYMCYDAAISPDSRYIAVSSPYMGLYLIPRWGGPVRRLLDFSKRRVSFTGLAFDERGTKIAVGMEYVATSETMSVSVVDIATGVVTSLPLRDGPVQDPYDGGVGELAFTADGRLVSAGERGIRAWDLASGRMEHPLPGVMATMSLSGDRRRLAVVSGGADESTQTMVFEGDAVVTVFELPGWRRLTLPTHGRSLANAVAIDATGDRIVTSDSSGVLRVGWTKGGEPHLLLGHAGHATDIVVSPDGKWIASASANEIRLWPMPDLSKPPFHALPYEQLMAKLRALTNLEVVADATATTGYRVEAGRFPGWKDVPAW